MEGGIDLETEPNDTFRGQRTRCGLETEEGALLAKTWLSIKVESCAQTQVLAILAQELQSPGLSHLVMGILGGCGACLPSLAFSGYMASGPCLKRFEQKLHVYYTSTAATAGTPATRIIPTTTTVLAPARHHTIKRKNMYLKKEEIEETKKNHVGSL